jgi:D-glycero-alpha-D-manno-heptose-7-phosphate kinase
MLLNVRAPVRIDFAGGWSDVPLFADTHGGATLNAAVELYVEGFAEVGGHADLNPTGKGAQGKAALSTGFEGVRIHYETAIPAGSGLGTSGALNVVWRALVEGQVPESEQQRIALAERAYAIEACLGIVGGKQDQCAAAFGGCTLYQFAKDRITPTRVQISPERLRELEGLLTLCYSGSARLSSKLHENVWGRYQQGTPEVVNALCALRDSAHQAKALLEGGDLAALGSLLSDQHSFARILEPSTDNDQVREVFGLVRNSIIGGKCCGAGGGGCIVFLSASERDQQRTAQTLQQAGVRIFPVRFTQGGISDAGAARAVSTIS